jgi:hypothetical protein
MQPATLAAPTNRPTHAVRRPVRRRNAFVTAGSLRVCNGPEPDHPPKQSPAPPSAGARLQRHDGPPPSASLDRVQARVARQPGVPMAADARGPRSPDLLHVLGIGSPAAVSRPYMYGTTPQHPLYFRPRVHVPLDPPDTGRDPVERPRPRYPFLQGQHGADSAVVNDRDRSERHCRRRAESSWDTIPAVWGMPSSRYLSRVPFEARIT